MNLNEHNIPLAVTFERAIIFCRLNFLLLENTLQCYNKKLGLFVGIKGKCGSQK